MRHLQLTILCSLLLAAGVSSATADSILLGSYSCVLGQGGGLVGEQLSGPVRVYLCVWPTITSDYWDCTEVGGTTAPLWEVNSAGTYDFTSASEGFTTLQSLWTDGIRGLVGPSSRLRKPSGGTWMAGLIMSESLFLGQAPDLVGYQIDFVRLHVYSVSLLWDPETRLNQMLVDTKWEVWGQPLPEPAGALLALVGLTVLRRR